MSCSQVNHATPGKQIKQSVRTTLRFDPSLIASFTCFENLLMVSVSTGQSDCENCYKYKIQFNTTVARRNVSSIISGVMSLHHTTNASVTKIESLKTTRADKRGLK